MAISGFWLAVACFYIVYICGISIASTGEDAVPMAFGIGTIFFIVIASITWSSIVTQDTITIDLANYICDSIEVTMVCLAK